MSLASLSSNLHLLCEIRTSISDASPSSGSLASCGSSMHAARSIGAMKKALLMSKRAVSSSSPFCARHIIDDKKSRHHFEDSPWKHCTEEFMCKQGSICPGAQLSSHKSASHFWSVCVSFVCHYPLDGNNCDASALCFCSTDFLVQSLSPNEFLPSFLRAQNSLEAVHL